VHTNIDIYVFITNKQNP